MAKPVYEWNKSGAENTVGDFKDRKTLQEQITIDMGILILQFSSAPHH